MNSKDNGRSSRYVLKIYRLISKGNHSAIIDWSPTEDGFVVLDISKFETEILPTLFKSSKFKSFRRQMNYYGFISSAFKGESGQELTLFYHPFFVKG